MKLFSPVVTIVGALAVSACDLPFISGGCAGVGYYALQMQIVDENGLPAALGAVVTVDDGDYHAMDSVIHTPLWHLAAPDRGGHTYDVRVEKRNYNTVTTRVKAKGGDSCVDNSNIDDNVTQMTVRLTPAPNASPVRALNLLPRYILLDRAPGNTSWAFTPFIETAFGTSRAIEWSITGDTASVGFDARTGVVAYKCRPTSGKLVITARSLVDPTAFASADIAVQGHPGASNDPPCGP
jgi:hypothetical protein